MTFIKKVLLKLRTLLIILLVIAVPILIIWAIYLLKGIVFNNNGIGGTITFIIISALLICILAYFLIKKGKRSLSEKENINKDIQGEKIYNTIKDKHSS